MGTTYIFKIRIQKFDCTFYVSEELGEGACPLTLFEATSESTLLADHKVTFFTFESQSVETSKPTKL